MDAQTNAFESRPAVLLSMRCDISAEAFVATRTQQADDASNAEDGFFVRGFHAPKLRLGEEHVPQMIFNLGTKKRFRLCPGSAMHAIG